MLAVGSFPGFIAGAPEPPDSIRVVFIQLCLPCAPIYIFSGLSCVDRSDIGIDVS